MGVPLAQELELMRSEVDDQQPAAGTEHPRRLGERPLGIVEVVQHLVDRDDIEGVAGERQMVDVAEPHLRIGDAGPVEIGARDRKHGGGGIDADRAAASGANSSRRRPVPVPRSRRASNWRLAERCAHRGLDRPFGDVERADRVPVGGILGEVAAGLIGLLALELRQALAVARKHRVAGVDHERRSCAIRRVGGWSLLR